jgi:hypothetical protein
MKSGFERVRVEITGLPGVEYGLIELSRLGKRAARVAVSFGPLRPYRQEPLVRRCRFFVSPTVTEDPGAQIRDFFALGLKIESDASAPDCVVAVSPVVQRLAQLTIDPGSFVVGYFAAPKMKAARLKVAERSRAHRRLTNFTNVAQLRGTLEAVGEPSFTCRHYGLAAPGKIGAIDARALAGHRASAALLGRTHLSNQDCILGH